MRLFGWLIAREKDLHPVATRPGWWGGIIGESFPGAWQRNVEVRTESVMTYAAVYGCVTLIASDIGKLRIRLVKQDENGIWSETESAAYSPVLRKPNRYQTRIAFFQNWVTSKLIHGNSYALKARDNRGVVTALYILDPCRVRPLVSDEGAVFYEIRRDNLTSIEQDVITVPASEVIHDPHVPLYHPLCGVSPITACGLAATQGLNIQNNSTKFFERGAKPAGILTAPGMISDDTAARLKAHFEANYSGAENAGRVAVLGDGLRYEQMTMSAVDAQLIEQLKWTAENVCSAFHVPPYMVGVGSPPTYNNIEALNQQYYSQCLQTLIESIEILLDEGLELKKSLDGQQYGTEFDLDDLLRMDTATRVKAAADAIGSGGMAPNEARKRYFDLGPVVGGESPYLQQQQFSLSALAERDRDKPFSRPETPPPAAPAAQANETDEADDGGDAAREIASGLFHLSAKFYDRKAA